jgi:hypothetical protein
MIIFYQEEKTMNHKTSLFSLRKIFVAIGLALAASGAQAATVSLDPVSATGPAGGQVAFSLVANFGSTPTIGGGVDFSWNSSVLTFKSFDFDPGFTIRDTSFDRKDLQTSSLFSVVFGNFGGLSLPADTKIGLVTFNLVGSPGSSSSIALSDSNRWAGFFTDAGSAINVSYTGATANVAPIPIPAAVWLLVSGLAGLAGVARRSKARA